MYKHRGLMRYKVVFIFSSRSYSSGRETDNTINKLNTDEYSERVKYKMMEYDQGEECKGWGRAQ